MGENRTSGSEGGPGKRTGRKAGTAPWSDPTSTCWRSTAECWVFNARHLRNVPGRKTDVGDAEWICQLVEHGLVRPSFVPPKEIRELRDLTRYRKAQIDERAAEAQRLDKVLQDAGIKLSSVATDILGKSGRRHARSPGRGTRDPEVLAELARGQAAGQVPRSRLALEGRFVAHHALIARTDPGQARLLGRGHRARSRAEIDRVIAPFGAEVELLDTITGRRPRSAECIIAEIGIDMGRFESSARLASWAGRCPGQHESAGKRKSRPAAQGLQVAGGQPGPSAEAAGRSKDTYLGAQFTRLRGRTATPRPARPSSTPSSSPPSTSSTGTCPTTTSVRTGSSAVAPKPTPAASPTRSKHSVTASPSNRPTPPEHSPYRHHPPVRAFSAAYGISRRPRPAPSSFCASTAVFGTRK